MTAIKIQNFGGISPRDSNRLQKPNEAVVAANAKLLSGELRGLRESQLLYDFSVLSPPYPIQRAFRLPATVSAPLPITTASTWLGFYDANVDFVRTPVTGDSFERYYWTGDSYRLSGQPQYNTRARINASSGSYLLGLPSPVNAPTVTPASGIDSTRSYVYTFVTSFGEEGPPSTPTIATGTAGSWTISGMDSAPPSPYNGGSSAVSLLRIYRTVAGLTTTAYYHVGDVSIGTTTYTDTALDATVALNYTLPSLTWVAPPATLQGLTAHPGGFLVGFSGRDLYMSEPYHPHAWPLQYIQTMQTEIVGVAIYGDVIVVMTTSHPYFGEGMSPLGITMQKSDSIDPCVSRRSIATTLNGVYYSSPQGIVLATGGETQLATQQLFTREEWQLYFSPTTVIAVPYGLQYIAFQTTATGFIFSPSEGLAPLTTLDRFSQVTMIQQDSYSGDVYFIQNNQVRLWDPPGSTPYTYTWTSKEFDLPKPVNMGAFRLKFQGTTTVVPTNLLGDYTTFNNGRIAAPLNSLNLAPINGVRTFAVAGYVMPQIKEPLGGSPMFNISSLINATGGILVDIYARDLSQNWVNVFSYTVNSEGTYRLPAGLKSDGWQVRFIGNVNVYSFAMAETAKELVSA